MENSKYQGTMYCHCDSTLTDRMKAADNLVKKLEYIFDNIDKSRLGDCMELLKDVENEIIAKCETPRVHLIRSAAENAESLFRNIIFQVKTIFREIYTAWIAGVQGHTPVYAECMDRVSQKINDEVMFQMVLKKKENTWRGRK